MLQLQFSLKAISLYLFYINYKIQKYWLVLFLITAYWKLRMKELVIQHVLRGRKQWSEYEFNLSLVTPLGGHVGYHHVIIRLTSQCI